MEQQALPVIGREDRRNQLTLLWSRELGYYLAFQIFEKWVPYYRLVGELDPIKPETTLATFEAFRLDTEVLL